MQADHLERCKTYINDNFKNEDLDVERLAKACFISKRYLHSIFSGAGMTVSSYIIAVRLDYAARILRSTGFQQFSVSEIAYESGFKSSAHFARAFKSRFDETPTNYRRHGS